jgi:hypothetical protein
MIVYGSISELSFLGQIFEICAKKTEIESIKSAPKFTDYRQFIGILAALSSPAWRTSFSKQYLSE